MTDSGDRSSPPRSIAVARSGFSRASEKAIAEIRASAVENIEIVAKDTAAAIVATMGGKADQDAISAAVGDRMKG